MKNDSLSCLLNNNFIFSLLLAGLFGSTVFFGCTKTRDHESEIKTVEKSVDESHVEDSIGGTSSVDKKVTLSDEEWKKKLTDEQYRICRQKGTERAFTGDYWNNKDKGVYHCVACGNELFGSDTKFDSGTGWPSFYDPMDENAVDTEVDKSLFTTRTEVHCNRCDSHLGHIFEDGPKPTGLRYCINSASLDFKGEEKGELKGD